MGFHVLAKHGLNKHGLKDHKLVSFGERPTGRERMERKREKKRRGRGRREEEEGGTKVKGMELGFWYGTTKFEYGSFVFHD